jgi:hypothetical protein
MTRRSKGSFIGGSTVITVHQSDKRMAERQASGKNVRRMRRKGTLPE